MGYQQAGHCYATPEAAATAAASEHAGSLLATSGGIHAVTVEAVTGTAITYRLISQSAANTLVVPYQAQQCQLIEAADALSLAWMVVGVWISAWAVRLAVATFGSAR